MYYMKILDDMSVLDDYGNEISPNKFKHKDFLLGRTRDASVTKSADDVLAGADLRVKIKKANGVLELTDSEYGFLKKAIETPGDGQGAYLGAFCDIYAECIRAFRNASQEPPEGYEG